VEPSIVHGQVMHHRLRPAANRFVYAAFCLRLPLSRLGELERRGLALNRKASVSFHERDHGARDGSPLLPWIRSLLRRNGIEADGEVVLHAFPRVLGYVFNPVSFWVCHGADGCIRAVLAEVNNTFGERHNYLLANPDGSPLASGRTLGARKRLHVSPFCEVRGDYEFRFHFEGERWLARIDYFDRKGSERRPLIATAISGRAEPLTPESVRGLLRRYGWFTAAVVARIHWQALRLWLKRVPFFTKPTPPLEETSR
jgi:DUF1365 family protein